MLDETHFYLNGYVNKQNCRFVGSENPRATHQHQLHLSKCTIWCNVMANRVIDPYFFENEDGTPETISWAPYRTMIENFLRPMAEQNPNLWFQHDGANAYTARQTMEQLREIFGKRPISKNSDFPWPPPLTDVTAPDFFYGDI
ncbi:uncharacterized protein TNCT_150611 [Trichonephila clavata]|uniref:Transposase n=1 Tax=Trichonephila clavata TaxID=2740835 RepID=A0A8X6JJD8_TRICU|nr:uncharacterized protein TNCT_150611 [Trichonephila clavata]